MAETRKPGAEPGKKTRRIEVTTTVEVHADVKDDDVAEFLTEALDDAIYYCRCDEKGKSAEDHGIHDVLTFQVRRID